MKSFVLLLIRSVLGCGLLISPLLAGAPPKDWTAWAKWAENLHPITDDQGHGPDIGSAEWSTALDRRLKISDPDGHGPTPGSPEWRQAVEKKLVPKDAEESREHLSTHETIARFAGLTEHVCLGRTSLCPDRCGDSGQVATFTIVKYLRYEKTGQYGDPKQEKFVVLIEDTMKNPKVPAAIRDAILALKPGDLVDLQWHHDYVTRNRSKFPECPISKITRLSKEQAEKAGENPR